MLFAQVYDRDADTWTNIPTSVNGVCGGWVRLSNGQVGLFAGHYGTLQGKQVRLHPAQAVHACSAGTQLSAVAAFPVGPPASTTTF
jgi:hypothetical protein